MIALGHDTVRFIDNFSAGTRGSLSPEYFLQQDYVVSSRSIHAWSDVSKDREASQTSKYTEI
jgi:hypothetical protein